MADSYRNIGRLVAVHGLQGELVLQHRLGRKTSLKGLKMLFLEERKDEMLPWFIEGTRVKGVTKTVLSRGRVIVENGKFLGKIGAGEFLKRENPARV